jgi:hypothetical protein
MTPRLLSRAVLAFAASLAAACGAVAKPSDAGHVSLDAHAPDAHHVDASAHHEDAGAHHDDANADAGKLTWYTTCGYPVCGGPLGADAAVPDAAACPAVGSPCTTKGAACGTPTQANCGVTLLCDDHSPAVECPLSTRAAKDGIEYADEAALVRLRDETLGIKLATYTYKPGAGAGDPREAHLGFIIEDEPEIQATNGARSRVDLYGYISMAVATMQVQQKEIAALQAEVAALKKATRARP